MVIPNALFSMGATATDCPEGDRANPWWYITKYIHHMVNAGVINEAGQAEVASYYELLTSKTKAMQAQPAQQAEAAPDERVPATPPA
eukprot:12018989-Heterocapsa_arctica.AAC.1